MMDYKLDRVTQDRISAFSTISSVLSTINVGSLPDLAASSSEFEIAPGDDLTTSTSVDPSIEVTIEQRQVLAMVDEVTVVDKGQLVDDMLHSQLADVPISQSRELLKDNETRPVNDEPLGDNMLQDP